MSSTFDPKIIFHDANTGRAITIKVEDGSLNRFLTAPANDNVLEVNFNYESTDVDSLGNIVYVERTEILSELNKVLSNFSYIETPRILVPQHNTQNWEGELLCSTIAGLNGTTANIVKVVWEISYTDDFKNPDRVELEYSQLQNGIYSYKYQPRDMGEMYIRVKYVFTIDADPTEHMAYSLPKVVNAKLNLNYIPSVASTYDYNTVTHNSNVKPFKEVDTVNGRMPLCSVGIDLSTFKIDGDILEPVRPVRDIEIKVLNTSETFTTSQVLTSEKIDELLALDTSSTINQVKLVPSSVAEDTSIYNNATNTMLSSRGDFSFQDSTSSLAIKNVIVISNNDYTKKNSIYLAIRIKREDEWSDYFVVPVYLDIVISVMPIGTYTIPEGRFANVYDDTALEDKVYNKVEMDLNQDIYNEATKVKWELMMTTKNNLVSSALEEVWSFETNNKLFFKRMGYGLELCLNPYTYGEVASKAGRYNNLAITENTAPLIKDITYDDVAVYGDRIQNGTAFTHKLHEVFKSALENPSNGNYDTPDKVINFMVGYAGIPFNAPGVKKKLNSRNKDFYIRRSLYKDNVQLGSSDYIKIEKPLFNKYKGKNRNDLFANTIYKLPYFSTENATAWDDEDTGITHSNNSFGKLYLPITRTTDYVEALGNGSIIQKYGSRHVYKCLIADEELYSNTSSAVYGKLDVLVFDNLEQLVDILYSLTVRTIKPDTESLYYHMTGDEQCRRYGMYNINAPIDIIINNKRLKDTIWTDGSEEGKYNAIKDTGYEYFPNRTLSSPLEITKEDIRSFLKAQGFTESNFVSTNPGKQDRKIIVRCYPWYDVPCTPSFTEAFLVAFKKEVTSLPNVTLGAHESEIYNTNKTNFFMGHDHYLNEYMDITSKGTGDNSSERGLDEVYGLRFLEQTNCTDVVGNDISYTYNGDTSGRGGTVSDYIGKYLIDGNHAIFNDSNIEFVNILLYLLGEANEDFKDINNIPSFKINLNTLIEYMDSIVYKQRTTGRLPSDRSKYSSQRVPVTTFRPSGSYRESRQLTDYINSYGVSDHYNFIPSIEGDNLKHDFVVRIPFQRSGLLLSNEGYNSTISTTGLDLTSKGDVYCIYVSKYLLQSGQNTVITNNIGEGFLFFINKNKLAYEKTLDAINFLDPRDIGLDNNLGFRSDVKFNRAIGYPVTNDLTANLMADIYASKVEALNWGSKGNLSTDTSNTNPLLFTFGGSSDVLTAHSSLYLSMNRKKPGTLVSTDLSTPFNIIKSNFDYYGIIPFHLCTEHSLLGFKGEFVPRLEGYVKGQEVVHPMTKDLYLCIKDRPGIKGVSDLKPSEYPEKYAMLKHTYPVGDYSYKVLEDPTYFIKVGNVDGTSTVISKDDYLRYYRSSLPTYMSLLSYLNLILPSDEGTIIPSLNETDSINAKYLMEYENGSRPWTASLYSRYYKEEYVPKHVDKVIGTLSSPKDTSSCNSLFSSHTSSQVGYVMIADTTYFEENVGSVKVTKYKSLTDINDVINGRTVMKNFDNVAIECEDSDLSIELTDDFSYTFTTSVPKMYKVTIAFVDPAAGSRKAGEININVNFLASGASISSSNRLSTMAFGYVKRTIEFKDYLIDNNRRITQDPDNMLKHLPEQYIASYKEAYDKFTFGTAFTKDNINTINLKPEDLAGYNAKFGAWHKFKNKNYHNFIYVSTRPLLWVADPKTIASANIQHPRGHIIRIGLKHYYVRLMTDSFYPDDDNCLDSTVGSSIPSIHPDFSSFNDPGVVNFKESLLRPQYLNMYTLGNSFKNTLLCSDYDYTLSPYSDSESLKLLRRFENKKLFKPLVIRNETISPYHIQALYDNNAVINNYKGNLIYSATSSIVSYATFYANNTLNNGGNRLDMMDLNMTKSDLTYNLHNLLPNIPFRNSAFVSGPQTSYSGNYYSCSNGSIFFEKKVTLDGTNVTDKYLDISSLLFTPTTVSNNFKIPGDSGSRDFKESTGTYTNVFVSNTKNMDYLYTLEHAAPDPRYPNQVIYIWEGTNANNNPASYSTALDSIRKRESTLTPVYVVLEAIEEKDLPIYNIKDDLREITREYQLKDTVENLLNEGLRKTVEDNNLYLPDKATIKTRIENYCNTPDIHGLTQSTIGANRTTLPVFSNNKGIIPERIAKDYNLFNIELDIDYMVRGPNVIDLINYDPLISKTYDTDGNNSSISMLYNQRVRNRGSISSTEIDNPTYNMVRRYESIKNGMKNYIYDKWSGVGYLGTLDSLRGLSSFNILVPQLEKILKHRTQSNDDMRKRSNDLYPIIHVFYFKGKICLMPDHLPFNIYDPNMFGFTYTKDMEYLEYGRSKPVDKYSIFNNRVKLGTTNFDVMLPWMFNDRSTHAGQELKREVIPTGVSETAMSNTETYGGTPVKSFELYDHETGEKINPTYDTGTNKFKYRLSNKKKFIAITSSRVSQNLNFTLVTNSSCVSSNTVLNSIVFSYVPGASLSNGGGLSIEGPICMPYPVRFTAKTINRLTSEYSNKYSISMSDRALGPNAANINILDGNYISSFTIDINVPIENTGFITKGQDICKFNIMDSEFTIVNEEDGTSSTNLVTAIDSELIPINISPKDFAKDNTGQFCTVYGSIYGNILYSGPHVEKNGRLDNYCCLDLNKFLSDDRYVVFNYKGRYKPGQKPDIIGLVVSYYTVDYNGNYCSSGNIDARGYLRLIDTNDIKSFGIDYTGSGWGFDGTLTEKVEVTHRYSPTEGMVFGEYYGINLRRILNTNLLKGTASSIEDILVYGITVEAVTIDLETNRYIPFFWSTTNRHTKFKISDYDRSTVGAFADSENDVFDRESGKYDSNLMPLHSSVVTNKFANYSSSSYRLSVSDFSDVKGNYNLPLGEFIFHKEYDNNKYLMVPSAINIDDNTPLLYTKRSFTNAAHTPLGNRTFDLMFTTCVCNRNRNISQSVSNFANKNGVSTPVIFGSKLYPVGSSGSVALRPFGKLSVHRISATNGTYLPGYTEPSTISVQYSNYLDFSNMPVCNFESYYTTQGSDSNPSDDKAIGTMKFTDSRTTSTINIDYYHGYTYGDYNKDKLLNDTINYQSTRLTKWRSSISSTFNDTINCSLTFTNAGVVDFILKIYKGDEVIDIIESLKTGPSLQVAGGDSETICVFRTIIDYRDTTSSGTTAVNGGKANISNSRTSYTVWETPAIVPLGMFADFVKHGIESNVYKKYGCDKIILYARTSSIIDGNSSTRKEHSILAEVAADLNSTEFNNYDINIGIY